MSDRLRVRYNRTAAELDRFLEVVEVERAAFPWPLPLLLAGRWAKSST